MIDVYETQNFAAVLRFHFKEMHMVMFKQALMSFCALHCDSPHAQIQYCKNTKFLPVCSLGCSSYFIK